MTVAPLLAVGFVMNLVAGLFVLAAIVLILVVLIQKGRGGGLSAAFGGGMASGLLGSKTGDFLTWATITLVAIYLVLAVLLDRYYKPTITEYRVPGQTTSTPQSATQGKATVPRPGSTTTNAGAEQTTPATQEPAGTNTDAGTDESQPVAQPPADAGGNAGTTAAPEPNASKG
jgi:preprotein translocase subunit SecG